MKKLTLHQNLLNALANAERQRRREKLNLPTNVSSKFWEQVARDYRKQINLENEEKLKSK